MYLSPTEMKQCCAAVRAELNWSGAVIIYGPTNPADVIQADGLRRVDVIYPYDQSLMWRLYPDNDNNMGSDYGT